MNCSILVRRAFLLAKLPRRRSFRTRMENQISIWLSHEALFGREVEGDAMLGLTQEGGAGELGSEHARLALDAELILEPAVASHETDDGLGKVDIEIVADDIPSDVAGGAARQA